MRRRTTGELVQHTGTRQRVVTADDVGGAVQAEVQQRRRGQAGGVALRTHDHPLDVVADGLRQPGVAGRVAAPFQDVALDHQRARDLALAESLGLRPDVDEHRAASQRVGHLGGGKAAIPAPGAISRHTSMRLIRILPVGRSVRCADGATSCGR